MQSLTQLLSRRDSLLTKQQWSVIENEVVEAARPLLQGRRVFAGATVVVNDPGRIQVEWNESSGMSEANISLLGEDNTNEDEVDHTPKTLTIPVLDKNFSIPWRLFEASKSRPTQFGPLDAQNAAEAAEVVSELEETLLATGKRGWKGLLNWSGIQTMAGDSWSADTDAGWEARVNNIVEARKLLQDEGFYGQNGRYQLLVNPAEEQHYHKVRATAGGQSTIEKIRAMAEIVPWSKVTAGKAYLRDTNRKNADLIIGLDMRPVELPKTGLNYRGRVMEILVPRVKRPKSIVEITGVA